MILNIEKFPNVSEVMLLVADVNYTKIVTQSQIFVSSYTLKKVKNEVYSGFIRVNRSVAVNPDFAVCNKDFVQINNEKHYFSRRRK